MLRIGKREVKMSNARSRAFALWTGGVLCAAGLASSAQAAATKTNLALLHNAPFAGAGLTRRSDGSLFGIETNLLSKVFKLTPPARTGAPWTRTDIGAFACLQSDQCYEQRLTGAPVVDRRGVVFGATRNGGTFSRGSIYRLVPPARGQTTWTQSTLISLNGDDTPTDGVVLAGGSLYVSLASSVEPAAPYGAILRLDPPACGRTDWLPSFLHRFTAAEGGAPIGNVLVRTVDGVPTLFGTTGSTVFKLVAPSAAKAGWTLTTLYTFPGGASGTGPIFGLIADRSLNLFGVASGGAGGHGLVYRLAPPALGATAWTQNVLYTFNGAADGNAPSGALVEDTTGHLYGVTSLGGTSGSGILYRLTPRDYGGVSLPWNKVTLHNFRTEGSNPANHVNPAGQLQIGGEEALALYGMTTADGPPGASGTVYRLDITLPLMQASSEASSPHHSAMNSAMDVVTRCSDERLTASSTP